ncbi:sugar kinase [Rhodohalobacter sp. 8-1]|uniref:sugar kinase n=1 Tax=Rhodohalobacter sp. 8-1 TaxID=3131972 RepID=UPI0030EC1995
MKKVITFGEIMLRLSPPGYLRFSQTNSFDVNFEGAESNVVVSLSNFGIPTELVTRVPKNDIGESAINDLRKHGVGVKHVKFGGERLGVYYLENGAVHRGGKVIYDRAHSALSAMETGMIDWEEVFDGAEWFHWTGITPALSQNAADVCKEAIEAANSLDLTVSVDFNFRGKLWNYGKNPSEVLPEMVRACDIILANELDAEQHFGIQPENKEELETGEMNRDAYLSVCRQLMDQLPKARKIITTRRETISASHNNWSGVLYNGDDFFESPKYRITHIVDRVGGGDSFMGALIYGLLTYKDDDQKALNFALAASCLKHTIVGDVNLVTVDEVKKLMEGDSSGRVSR